MTFAFDEKILKLLPIPKPGGLLDIITKPKLPGTGFQLGSHFGTNAGTGSFGFGFGFGGQFGSSGTGLSVPPKEKDLVKPNTTQGKEKPGPRPNWGEEDPSKYDSIEEENKPPKYETREKEDKRLDWEEIGEIDKDPKAEYLMDGELVNDGLIQPRNNRNRGKRFIESKIYHVPLVFRSNAKPYQVKIHSSPNNLLEENSRM